MRVCCQLANWTGRRDLLRMALLAAAFVSAAIAQVPPPIPRLSAHSGPPAGYAPYATQWTAKARPAATVDTMAFATAFTFSACPPTCNTSFGMLDLTTGVFQQITLLANLIVTDLALAPNGTLYAITFTASSEGSFSNPAFVTIATNSGAINAIAPDTVGLELLSFSPNGTLYAASITTTSQNALYTVDPANGQPTFVANIAPPLNNTLVNIRFLGNTLYATDYVTPSSLYTIDTTNGSVTRIGSTGLSLNNYLGGMLNGALLDIAAVDSSRTSGQIFSINPATGAATPVAATSAFYDFTLLSTSTSPPVITSLSPSSANLGGAAFPLTVNGSGLFCALAPCAVIWQPASGSPTNLSAVPNADGTMLTATVPAALISVAGSVSVSVQADGGASNSLPFTINAAVPTITSLSPPFTAAGTPGLTLTVNGSNFFACAPSSAPCLAVHWQPAVGNSTVLPAQANAAGTQLTASVPATLLTSPGTASVTVQAAGGTAHVFTFLITSNTSGSPTTIGHLLFPNVGLNALQEFDPVSRTVVNTIPMPAPFSFNVPFATVRIRAADHGILAGALTAGDSAVVSLSSSGQFVAAALVGGLLQQLAFDPLDASQSTVLAGNPPSSSVIAVNPYTDTVSTRIFGDGADYTGLAADAANNLYAGDNNTGTILRFLPNGTQTAVFANVLNATGSSEIGAMAIDSANQLYVAQPGSDRIARFGSDGSFLGFLTNPSFHRNNAVYFNPIDGLLYAGNEADDALIILTTFGEPVAVVHMGGQSVGVPDLVPGAAAPSQGELESTQTGLTFQVPQGMISPPPQSFTLINNASAAVTFRVAPSTVSGGTWLTVSGGGTLDQGAASAPITVAVNPTGLAQGDYYGMIEIDSGAPNSPDFVTVVLNVLPAAANPGASVTPTGLVFTSVNSATPPPQSVQITNVLSRSTGFTAAGSSSSGPLWFSVSPTGGTVESGQTMSVSVQPNAALATGIYRGTLTLQFPQDNATREIDLLLVVAPGAGQSTRVRRTQQPAAACTPTQLLLVFSRLGAGFTQPASWPGAVETVVVDDCATIVSQGTVTVRFSNGDSQISLLYSSNNEGSWSGSWTPLHVINQSLTLTATAMSEGLTGSAMISGSVQPNPNPVPTLIQDRTVVSAASYAPAAMPSPGELVAISGMNLADTAQAAPPMLPFLPTLGNTFVLIGGQQMPLLYVSGRQVNAIIPYTIAGGVKHRAIAKNGARLSVPQRVHVATAEPAVFTVDESGTGQGHIYIEPGQIPADASSPATAGDYLTIYCSGLGPVTVPSPVPPVVAGYPAPGLNCPSPLTSCAAQTANPVTVMIGGQPAIFLFAGLSPGSAGLYQVNVQIPMTGVPKGNQIPVVITVAGVSSVPVTMAIK